MDSRLAAPQTHHHRHYHRFVPPNSTPASPPWSVSCASSSSYRHTCYTKNPSYLSINHLRPSFPVSRPTLTARPRRCHATSPGSPPPDGEKQSRLSEARAMSTFSKVQDAVRIFLAVLFWMSLFFWSCASNGRNNGQSNKDSRFRR